MSSEHPQEASDQQPNDTGQVASGSGTNSDDIKPAAATVLVRGETVPDQKAKSDSNTHNDKADGKPKSAKVSEEKVRLQSRLPALEDDGDEGVQTEHLVVRDGEPDLRFTGSLLASAAPTTAPKGEWQEFRIYETDGGKHVFSKITRNIAADVEDKHEVELFDPDPASMTTRLLRKAHDATHERPMAWTDSAAHFFGYEPLSKALYRKLGSQFEEHIR